MRADAPEFIPIQHVQRDNSLNSSSESFAPSLKKNESSRDRRNRTKKKSNTPRNGKDDASKDSSILKNNDGHLHNSKPRKNGKGRRQRGRGKRQNEADSQSTIHNLARARANKMKEEAKVDHRKKIIKGTGGDHSNSRSRKSKKSNRQRKQHKHISPDDVAKEEMPFNSNAFPSLPSSAPQLTQKSLDLNQERVGSIWSQVAFEGYEQSERKRIEEFKELEKRQHELDTFTRMDVFTRKSSEVQPNENIVGFEKAVSDPLRINPLPSIVGKLLNVDKLRRRWSFAIEKQRKVEEERALADLENQRYLEESIVATNDNTVEFSTDEDTDEDSDGKESIDDSYQVTEEASWFTSEKTNLRNYLEKPFPLHYSIIENDEAAMIGLMQSPPEITFRDERVFIDDLEIPSTCDFPPQVEVSELRTRLSIMHLAIILERTNLLKALLSFGNQLKYVTSTLAMDDLDDQRRTPTMLACEYSLDSIIRILLSYGPKLVSKHQKTGDCALHIACRKGQASTVDLILGSRELKSKSSVRQRLICCRNRKGQTPLHTACSVGRFDILNVLLSNSASATIDKALSIEDHMGLTPLFVAISVGATDIVMHLMTRRVNRRSDVPLTHSCPLALAVTTRSVQMVHLLLDCGPLSVFHTFDYTQALCQVISCFEDSSEEAIELIDLFINAGADPHTIVTFRQNSITAENDYDCAALRNRPLTHATLRGKVKCVAKMLDSYKIAQKRLMRSLREDPVLTKQPTSYFLSLEEEEKKKLTQSLEETLISTLHLVIAAEEDNYLSNRQFGCCLAILRRGESLDSSAFNRILRTFRPEKVNSRDMLAPDEAVYEGCYSHIQVDTGDVFNELTVGSPYAKFHYPFSQSWSYHLSQLSWIWDRASSYEDMNCRYLKEAINSGNYEDDHSRYDEDTCFLIVDGQRLRAHKSILSFKSGKFEAAIRFADMKSDDSTTDSLSTTEICLDIPLKYVRILTMHCYHGSIVTGLSSNLTQCVEELLDLYLIAQEFLCPSLAMECEMRLLSSTPYRCFCWNCCEKVETKAATTDDQSQMKCFYHVKGPSKLLCANNYLGVISQVQDIESVHSQYSITRKGCIGFLNASFDPLSVLKSIVWKKMLLDFPQVLKSEAYLSLCHSTLTDDEETRSAEYFECFGDQVGILLLRSILDELAVIPPELVFMSPSSIRSVSNYCSDFMTTEEE